MSTTEITKFTKELQSQSRAIESMLPTGMEVKRFLRTVVNTIHTHAQSERLLAADRQSLFNACQKAAGDGLLLDGREATLVVFRDKKQGIDRVSYIPMVQGLVHLARNSGEISSITAEIVCRNDSFAYKPGIDKQPLHDPDWFGDRGQPIGCYSVVTLKDGEKVTSVMPKSRIMEIASAGNNAKQYIPGQGPNYGEWWRKTVIKNALKYCPKSTYLESALSNDSKSDTDPVVVVEPESIDIEKASAEIKKSIARAKNHNELVKLQGSITNLPVEHQETLVDVWNEKAIEFRNREEAVKPSETGGVPEHHAINPETGEIVQADMA